MKKLMMILVLSALLCANFLSLGARKEQVAHTTVTVAGSTSMAPLIEALAVQYLDSSVKIQVQTVGSTAGLNMLMSGTADIALSSRDLTEKEAENAVQTEIALDGLAVVVHPDNPIAMLSTEQLRQVFTGEVTNWNELGGGKGDIIVISREMGAGTRDSFEQIMGLSQIGDTLRYSLVEQARPLICEGNGAVKASVSAKRNAVGYLSMSVLDEHVKPIGLDGVLPTLQNIKGETYRLARPLLVVTRKAPAQDVQAFIDFVLSEEGQKIIEQNGFAGIYN